MRKALFNQLSLAFPPVCNYDFAHIKTDEGFQESVRESMIYVIVQRPELTFDQIQPRFHPSGQTVMQFTIRQRGNPGHLTCELPLYQDAYAKDINKEVAFHMEYAFPKPEPMPKDFPQNNVTNIFLTYHDGQFIGWLSPEMFLQNFLIGAIEASLDGPIESFLTYQVHYVGKAIEQDIWKRLTGHATLQEILSVQYPLHFGTLPTHEIALLFLKIHDAIGTYTITGREPVPQEMIDAVLGKGMPSHKTIANDAEKALIQAMQPGYNKEFYNNYPKSKDGLASFGLANYSFQIYSPIILQYKNGTITGERSFLADTLVVEADKPLRIIRNRQKGDNNH